MANKINYTKGKHKYYRTSLLIGYNSDGKKIMKEFYGKSKGEAEHKKEEYKQDLKNGINKAAENETLNNAFNSWLINVILPSGIKTSTYETYESIYRLYIKDSKLGIRKVKDIKPIMVQAFLNELFNKGKHYPLLVKTHKLIKRFFNYEIETDAVIKNPCSSIKVPGQVNYLKEKNSIEITVFTQNERDKILKYLYKTNNRIAGIAYLGFSLGMREGEILALKWNDVDTENRILHIRESIRYTKDFDSEGKVIGASIKITVPKTLTSVRDIEYPDSFDDMWKKAKLQNDKDKLKAGNSFKNKYNLVFTDTIGNPISKRYVIRQWQKALNALNIEYRTFHKTRHTFITQMAIDGVPESITQAIVGHKKGSEITHNIYTHINKENTKKALENYRITVPNV
ncbi:site-specific integrase [Clostridium autoethanogenum]|uniref:Site-specific integrase n=1 Tax=Clostridium autoethanogenum TaxID=84023 RepID=A0A3M0T2V5_9CLOT|nr:site-specific integrase [Clostridium autoethanogenum]RMD04944.1 site-specific integrase [Clostridium autoethanogenum]